MALPDTRNTTYTPGSQVKSVDLNAIQDEIIALDDWLTGNRAESAIINGALDTSGTITSGNSVLATGVIAAGGNVVSGTGDLVAQSGDVKYNEPRDRWAHAASGAGDPAKWHMVTGALFDDIMIRNAATGALPPWIVGLTVEEGETITSWGVVLDNTDGVGVIHAELNYMLAGAPINVGSVSKAAGAGRSQVSSGTIAHVVQPGAYFLSVYTTSNPSSVDSLGIAGVRITVHRAP